MNKLTAKNSLNSLLKMFALTFSLFYVLSSMAAQSIDVSEAYVRATIPGTKISSAYMTIANHSANDVKLVAVKGAISDRIEIHEHTMADGMMKMRQVESLLIKSHDTTVLQPSGYHLMIFNLEKPLVPKQTVKLTLIFDDKNEVELELPVQSIKKQKKKAHEHHH